MGEPTSEDGVQYISWPPGSSPPSPQRVREWQNIMAQAGEPWPPYRRRWRQFWRRTNPQPES